MAEWNFDNPICADCPVRDEAALDLTDCSPCREVVRLQLHIEEALVAARAVVASLEG